MGDRRFGHHRPLGADRWAESQRALRNPSKAAIGAWLFYFLFFNIFFLTIKNIKNEFDVYRGGRVCALWRRLFFSLFIYLLFFKRGWKKFHHLDNSWLNRIKIGQLYSTLERNVIESFSREYNTRKTDELLAAFRDAHRLEMRLF